MNEKEFAGKELKVRSSIYNQGYRDGMYVACWVAVVAVIGILIVGGIR